MGAKYSDDVARQVYDLNLIRSIARNMNETMIEQEKREQGFFNKKSCESSLYHALKTSILSAFREKKTFSDANLLALVYHEREHVVVDKKGNTTPLQDVTKHIGERANECLSENDKDSVSFLWFESLLATSAVCFGFFHYFWFEIRRTICASISFTSKATNENR